MEKHGDVPTNSMAIAAGSARAQTVKVRTKIFIGLSSILLLAAAVCLVYCESKKMDLYRKKALLSETKVLAAADSGNGIPKEILDKLMQPFFTTKATS